MPLTNYRDISPSTTDVSAGFQFEFFCEKCGETSRSAFKPYRKGQLTGWLGRFAFLFYDINKASRATGAFAEVGASSARNEALADAMAMAAPLYERCTRCNKWAGRECWNSSTDTCRDCAAKAGASAGAGAAAAGYGASSGGAVCANCQTPSQGGRFCHECGFDMASTHKSCPACGVTLPRQARFCTDCGHGF